MGTSEPSQLGQIEQEERDAQLRLAEAREQAKLDDGEAPAEHNALLQKLEDEWHHARERVEQALHGKKD
jgi:vacuolar-type H+-ATPase subunit H